MALLLAFAFVAGAATALSPCVLPVLPVALAAGATGGRRRPLGVVIGLAASFTFATVALVYVIDALGLPDELLRDVAIVVLLASGSRCWCRRWRRGSRPGIGRRRAPAPARRTRTTASARASLLGASLGFVYAPCAGPILAGVITVSASQDFTAGRLAVALAYAVGSAVVLYVLMLGGRRLTAPARAPRGPAPDGHGRRDGRRGRADAGRPRHPLPDRDRRRPAGRPGEPVEGARGERRRARPARPSRAATGPSTRPRRAGTSAGSELPVLGAAPDFTGNQRWFNTPDGRPLSLRELRGKVVLVDFWTYTCINCIRTLPYLKAWDARYRDDGLDDRRRAHAGVPVRARRRQRGATRSARTGSATRSPRTTTTPPGTRTATSTGPRST